MTDKELLKKLLNAHSDNDTTYGLLIQLAKKFSEFKANKQKFKPFDRKLPTEELLTSHTTKALVDIARNFENSGKARLTKQKLRSIESTLLDANTIKVFENKAESSVKKLRKVKSDETFIIKSTNKSILSCCVQKETLEIFKELDELSLKSVIKKSFGEKLCLKYSSKNENKFKSAELSPRTCSSYKRVDSEISGIIELESFPQAKNNLSPSRKACLLRNSGGAGCSNSNFSRIEVSDDRHQIQKHQMNKLIRRVKSVRRSQTKFN